MTRRTITRRTLLSSTATGASAWMLAPGLAAGQPVSTNSSCAHMHKIYADTLGRYVASPGASDASANLALRTAACPDCGTALHPSGF